MLPNFFVVGAQKSGTTSLHEYLRAHPQIYLPEQKETKFFVNDKIFAKGMEYYERQFFGDWSGEPVVGEVDPDYMYFDHGLTRIAENLDLVSLKFIFLFRNPVDRAFSHYLMTYRRGLESLSFEDALEAEPDRISQSWSNRMHYSYFDRGLYAKQLHHFMKVVNLSNMHFILSDRLASNPEDELARCLDFLELNADPATVSQHKQVHQATVPKSTVLLRWILKEGWHKNIVRKLLPNKEFRLGLRARLLSWNERSGSNLEVSPRLRKELLRRYTEDIVELQKLTNLNLEHWLNEGTK
jgi:Sulfotransferase domain